MTGLPMSRYVGQTACLQAPSVVEWAGGLTLCRLPIVCENFVFRALAENLSLIWPSVSKERRHTTAPHSLAYTAWTLVGQACQLQPQVPLCLVPDSHS